MRISARNQIKGTVVEVKKGATTSHVRVDIGNGQIVTSSITNEAVDELGIKAKSRDRGGEGLRRHDRSGLIMRAASCSSLLSCSEPLPHGGGRTERLRQVQMADRARARCVDRAGSHQACIRRRTRRVAGNRDDARLCSPRPTPSCRRRPNARRRKAPLRASRISRTRRRPVSTRSACPPAPGSTWFRTAIPEAKGFQRRHRLRRHSQDHEIRDFGEPVRAADQRRQGEFASRSRSCRRNRPAPRTSQMAPLTLELDSACYCFRQRYPDRP